VAPGGGGLSHKLISRSRKVLIVLVLLFAPVLLFVLVLLHLLVLVLIFVLVLVLKFIFELVLHRNRGILKIFCYNLCFFYLRISREKRHSET
jgi:hypothetical protein